MTGNAHLADGRWAETETEAFLRRQGLQLVRRNFRCRRGEIDLIMTDAEVLIFVEVRYRRPSAFGTGADSITVGKRRRLLAAAGFFLASGSTSPGTICRFDVVSVTRRDHRAQFQWIRNAFTADD